MSSTADGFRVQDQLSRLVAIGAVIATLLAGLVAFLLVWTSNNANQAGLEADKLGIRAMGELTRTLSEAEADYQAFVAVEELRTREGLSHQEHELAEAGGRHGLARNRWSQLAAESMRLLGRDAEDLTAGGIHGPESDPAFPERFLAAQTEQAVRHAAMQDAYNEKAALHGKKVAQYIAIITMFGVALYLFALLSVSIQNDIRRLFAVVGAVLLLAGSIWTGIVAIGRVPPVDKTAAEEFAKGHVALASAHDRPAYLQAIGHFDAATKARPTFARAYFERATARLLAASQQSSASVLSHAEALDTAVGARVLTKVTADLKRAHHSGLASAPVLGRLGYFLFLRGLLTHNNGMVEKGIEYTLDAIAIDPAEPTWRLNHALALLTGERYDDAMAEYRRGLCLAFVEVQVKESELEELQDHPCSYANHADSSRSTAQVRVLKAEALSNVELAAETEEEDALPYLHRVAGMIVGSTPGQIATGVTPSPHLARLQLDVAPTTIRFDVDDQLATRRDISVVTSYRHNTSGTRYVIPELSHRVRIEAGNALRLNLSPKLKPFRCLPSGSYRVDLYADDRLIGRGATRASLAGVHHAAVAPDLDLRTCVPDEWTFFAGSLPGLMHGEENRTGTHQAFLFRFQAHPERDAVSTQRFSDWAIELLGGDVGDATGPRTIDAGYFGILEQPVRRTYDVDGSVAVVQAGLDVDEVGRSGVVAVVKGPASWVHSPQATRILDSVSPFYEATEVR